LSCSSIRPLSQQSPEHRKLILAVSKTENQPTKELNTRLQRTQSHIMATSYSKHSRLDGIKGISKKSKESCILFESTVNINHCVQRKTRVYYLSQL